LHSELSCASSQNKITLLEKLASNLPSKIFNYIISEKYSDGKSFLDRQIELNNSRVIKFIIKKGIFIHFDIIKGCDNQQLCLDMMHWASIRGNEMKQNPIDFGAITSKLPNLFQKHSVYNSQLLEYLKVCQLISSTIPIELDTKSLRYRAINTLYKIAKEYKKSEETHNEVMFFKELDERIKALPADKKEQGLRLYNLYAERKDRTSIQILIDTLTIQSPVTVHVAGKCD